MALSLRSSERGARQFVLERGRDLLLGSSGGCDLVIRDATVSRRHVNLRVEDQDLLVTELGSRNGTRLNGVALVANSTIRATIGDKLSFGEFDTVVEWIDDDDADVAMEVDTMHPVGDTAPAATLRASASDPFVARAVPELLEALANGCDRLQFARALGEALARTSSAAVRITAVDEATESTLIFDHPGLPPFADSAETTAGGIHVRLGLPVEQRPDTTHAMLRLATAMLKLSRPVQTSVTPEPGAPTPEPRTLDPVMQRNYRRAVRAARGGLHVLIRGESGTGKELFARYLHNCSNQPELPFVALNCAALPESLLEAELFGVEKGTATGVDARAGVFERADGGTLFLDEVGDMAAATQAKILRVLQEREVIRLGGSRARPARVRVVSATNRDLDQMLIDGSFRLDLLHRIADWEVVLPPLRERIADIGNLAVYFLARATQARGIGVRGVSRRALESLQSYEWPGNIRELEREMTRIAAFVDHASVVTSSDLRSDIVEPAQASRGPLEAQLSAAERSIIARALAQCDANVASAATRLGISRATLYRRMSQLGLGSTDAGD